MLLKYILQVLDIKPPEGSEYLADLSFGVFILSLLALLSFLNITGYFLSLHLIQRYDFTTKYPKFKKIVNFYEKSSLFLILMETLFCLGCLTFLVISAFMVFKNIFI